MQFQAVATLVYRAKGNPFATPSMNKFLCAESRIFPALLVHFSLAQCGVLP